MEAHLLRYLNIEFNIYFTGEILLFGLIVGILLVRGSTAYVKHNSLLVLGTIIALVMSVNFLFSKNYFSCEGVVFFLGILIVLLLFPLYKRIVLEYSRNKNLSSLFS